MVDGRLDRLGKEVAQIGTANRTGVHSRSAGSVITQARASEFGPALDRIILVGLLFRQGVPSHASYLFKHALVQGAAYGSLLREPRRALHARNIAENQPEILARHCNKGDSKSDLFFAERRRRGRVRTEKAAGIWGKAGQRSTKAAAEQARLLIEKAEALGEPLEDPLLLFSVLFGFWVANYLAFNGDVMRDLRDLVHGLTHFDRGVAATIQSNIVRSRHALVQTLGCPT